jgi:hypothetical protein
MTFVENIMVQQHLNPLGAQIAQALFAFAESELVPLMAR